MRSVTSLAAALAIAGGATAACGVGEAGMELPRQHDGESFPGHRQELTGVLHTASNGCLELVLESGTYFVIWPNGSDDADLENVRGVRLPSGDAIAPGDTVTGVGAFTSTARLTAERDGYWQSTIGYCAPDALELVVFDSAQRGE